jgi:hypothetical protein
MADKKPLSPEAQKVLDARKAAAAELQGIDGKERPLDHPQVVRLSTARLYEAAITMRVLGGEKIQSSEIKASDDMVQAARAAVEAERVTTVDVRFHPMANDHEVCPVCGWRPPSLSFEEYQQSGRDRIAREEAAKVKARGEPVVIDGEAVAR